MSRASQSLKDKRVFQIYQWLLQGYNKRSLILQLTSDSDLFKEGLSDRQIDTYIAHARELIKDKISNSADVELDMALDRLDDLYTLNYRLCEFKECRSVVMDRLKVLGLLTDKKEVEATIHTEQPLFTTPPKKEH